MGIDLATIQAMANASQEERLAMTEALISEEDEKTRLLSCMIRVTKMFMGGGKS